MTRTLCSLLLGFGLCLVTAGTSANPDRVVVPGNGTGYDPQLKVLAEIRDEVRGLRDEVKLLRSGAPVKPGPDRRAAQQQYILRACAGCHTPARIEDGKDGGALVLFNDDQSKTLNRALKEADWVKIADYVKRGDMPPKPRDPGTAQEKALFE